MNLSARLRRQLLFVGGALALLAAGFAGRVLAPTPSSSPSEEPPHAEDLSDRRRDGGSPQASIVRLRHPPSAIAELGVLTDRPDAAMGAVLDRASLAALVRSERCGDEDACGAVRAALRDEHTTTLQVVPASAWHLREIDVDANASTLSAHERALVAKQTRIVVVRVAAAPSARQVPVRAAFAAAAAIAETLDGLVYDQLLGRIEDAPEFAAHAVNAPLSASAFRKDRVALLYEPRGAESVRLLTAGLSRWGGPDVEAEAVPTAMADRMGDLVLAVAEAIANGARSGSVMLSRDDLARARGAQYPPDVTLPEAAPVAVELLSVLPESGDPNDFMARIQPPTGTGPLAFLDLSARFFGSDLAAAPGEEALRAGRDEAQRDLPGALARWKASRVAGGQPLLVRLPFAIADDGGTESMWIDVTRYDARSLTGKLVDDPLRATQLARGDEVTRPRVDVEAIDPPGPRDR